MEPNRRRRNTVVAASLAALIAAFFTAWCSGGGRSGNGAERASVGEAAECAATAIRGDRPRLFPRIRPARDLRPSFSTGMRRGPLRQPAPS